MGGYLAGAAVPPEKPGSVQGNETQLYVAYLPDVVLLAAVDASTNTTADCTILRLVQKPVLALKLLEDARDLGRRLLSHIQSGSGYPPS